MKLNYKYIHALACDGKKFAKKKKRSSTTIAVKMEASLVNRGLSP